MVKVSVEVPFPLQDCFLHCEIYCVRECCGIDAFSTDQELITHWGHQVGPAVVDEARCQLADLVSVVEDRSHQVEVPFLHYYPYNEDTRLQLLEFLIPFLKGLETII